MFNKALKIILFIFGLTFQIHAQQSDKDASQLILSFDTLDERSRANAFIGLFSTEYVMQDIDEALAFVREIEDYATQSSDTILIISSYVLTAEYHWRRGNYQESIEQSLEAIRLARHDRFSSEKARALQTVGTTHFFSGNPLKAIEYYRKASLVFKEANDMKAYTSAVSNIGAVYADMGEKEGNTSYLDSALLYLNLVIDQKGNAIPSVFLAALGNSAYTNMVKGDYKEAKRLYTAWEEAETEYPNPTSKASQYAIIGELYMKTGELSIAESYLINGLNMAKEIESAEKQSTYYDHLSQLMEKKNQHKKALDFAKASWNLKDSLFNIEKIKAVEDIETKYQTAQKEKEILEANTELERKERFQFFLLVVIGVVVVFSIIAILLIIQRAKLKSALMSQEIDTLRLQIQSIFPKSRERIKLDPDTLNHGLHKPLSEREIEILQHALTDKTNREIGETVFLSINTVKFHLKNIYEKLGVSNRNEALEKLISNS